MTYPLVPIGLIIVFIAYVAYLAFVRKNLKSKINTVVLPGLFFIIVWLVIYYFILK